ncbi:intein N-terminal splicing region [Bradyrhizobium lablabi]|uniref:Intein N-terminal splicing region n=1 Tax=Bradyrhizobium lablabi TaxID=722472 RepID=A0A1M6MRJ4_9BRAD|nr:Hint domain-containing protein [Bradyrhizobium lablabi]SHJ86128.1 intein N-terminal splicing region [Bradyrhizobium lablabi]
MRDFQQGGLPNSARRHFLGISAAVAGRIAAVGAASLPILASTSKRAKAEEDDDHHGHDGHDGHHCFLRGTRILTPRGEVPIEELAIGALVETLNGPLPVRWIGRQTFKKTASRWPSSVAPIRVARFALDDQYPSRDLYLSPTHSLFVDGFLIPVKHLVNGTSVAPAQMDDREVIEYFHIELETHEVVFAEGAPAETLQVTTDREGFANFVEYERLYGSDERPAMAPFAPLLRFYGGRAELQGLLRLALSPIVDVRDPIQRARARIDARAELVDV